MSPEALFCRGVQSRRRRVGDARQRHDHVLTGDISSRDRVPWGAIPATKRFRQPLTLAAADTARRIR